MAVMFWCDLRASSAKPSQRVLQFDLQPVHHHRVAKQTVRVRSTHKPTHRMVHRCSHEDLLGLCQHALDLLVGGDWVQQLQCTLRGTGSLCQQHTTHSAFTLPD